MVARTFLQLCDEVEAKLRALGLTVHAGSRFGEMISLYRQHFAAGTIIEVADPAFPIACQAWMDLQQADFVCDQLRGVQLDREVQLRLRDLGRDPALPQESGPDTPGRDAQLELFVFALCRRCGFRPEFRREFDLLLHQGRFTRSAEVKRLKSWSSLENVVRKASKQVAASGSPGFMFLDVSVAANAEMNEIIGRPLTDGEFDRRHGLVYKRVLDEQLPRMKSWIGDRPVAGIVLMGGVVRFTLERKPCLDTRQTSACLATPGSDLEKCFHEFQRRYDYATFGIAQPPFARR